MAHIHQISVSGRGGVPKLGVESAEVTVVGLVGDAQRDTKGHGGPERAVCVFSLEVIERLAAEGHPIVPGSVGENVTVCGVDWPRVVPGARLRFAGGVELEVTSYTTPCSAIRGSFAGGAIHRINQKERPGESRVYARVVRVGRLGRGEGVELIEAPSESG